MSEDKPLHVRVAEALGWTYCGEGECGCEGEPPAWHPRADFPRRLDQHIGIDHYDTDWLPTGPLIEKYGICYFLNCGVWHAYTASDGGECGDGSTPLIAVCNLILELKKVGKL